MTMLYLMPVLLTIATAYARVHSVRGTRVLGTHDLTIATTLRDRIRYHRVSMYALGTLLMLGALTAVMPASLQLVAIALMAGVVAMPMRYRITTGGVAMNNVVFRPWSEFTGFHATRDAIRLIGAGTNGRFDIRVTGERQALLRRVLVKRLPMRAGEAGRAVGLTSRRALVAASVLVPVVALIVAIAPMPAFAEGPDDGPMPDPAGTSVGAPEDLGGVTVGGGSLAVLDKEGAIDAAATAKLFADAQAKEPFAYNLAAYVNQNRIAINMMWTLVAGFLVMFMQAGFAMVETGFCRAKSAMHVMMTNFMVYGVGMLAFWAVGFGLMFGGVGGAANLGGGVAVLNQEFTVGGYGLFGMKGFFLGADSWDVSVATLFLFQMVFMDTAATILTGAVAERWTWLSFLIWSVVIGAVIYPIFGNWAWGAGWLFQLKDSSIGRPYVDFAGSGVVHSIGGWAAIAAAIVLGPRIGKYNRDGSANALPGHDINMAAVGTFILAFGWFGFNAGSTLGASGNGNLRIGEIAVVTMLAGAAGSLTSMLYAKATVGKYDPGYMINGILAGLVAITAPSGYVGPGAAVVIGGIAGVLVCVTMVFVDQVLKIDDPVGAFSVHGVNGIFGVLCVGIFADGTAPDYLALGYPVKGILYGDGAQLVAQLIGSVTAIVWAFGTSFILFSVLKAMGIYRSKPEDEVGGLDLPEMGMHAYPPQIVSESEMLVRA